MQKITNKILIILLFIAAATSLFTQEAPVLTAEGAVLMDYATGRILFDKHGDIPRPPASMTKLVTLYLGCEALEKGEFDRKTPIHVTETGSAFSRPPGSSLMLLEEGQTLDYLTLLQGIAVSSGNDGAYQLAELIAGTPEDFVDRMNLLVYSLGYGQMHFVDPDGWSAEDRVTPLSYAGFARDYIGRFPWALTELHSRESLTYPAQENIAPEGLIQSSRTKKNTNWLLGEVEGVDGLKTGYIDESGFNFTATAKRGETRFIAVIMGVFTDVYRDGLTVRAQEAGDLLEYGFDNWKTAPLPAVSVPLKVYSGKKEETVLIPEKNPLFTWSRDEEKSLTWEFTTAPWLRAPLPQGSPGGSVTWYFEGEPVGTSALVTEEALEKGGFFHNFIDLFEILFYNISHRNDRVEE
ncbi:MAG: D-alanyl-D-alanine carboxypeptidase [Spirochaetales bacterium]|nr:D-alanyl-D-alanine carboxypeptidase [Spirochaetales bacterium]